MPILLAQRNERRTETMTELKEDGVPYEERIEALEKVEWHQPPNSEWLRHQFENHLARKPYLKDDLLQPKSVTRYMLERDLSLTDFIREFGLKRSEGVLLRYVSQTIKYIRQTLPAQMISPELTEYVAQLESLVRGV